MATRPRTIGSPPDNLSIRRAPSHTSADLALQRQKLFLGETVLVGFHHTSKELAFGRLLAGRQLFVLCGDLRGDRKTQDRGFASAPYWIFRLIDAAAIDTNGYALLPHTPFLNRFRFIESEKIRI